MAKVIAIEIIPQKSVAVILGHIVGCGQGIDISIEIIMKLLLG
jgi:hypothetical protein